MLNACRDVCQSSVQRDLHGRADEGLDGDAQFEDGSASIEAGLLDILARLKTRVFQGIP